MKYSLVGNIVKFGFLIFFTGGDKGCKLYLFLMNNEGNELFTLRTQNPMNGLLLPMLIK